MEKAETWVNAVIEVVIPLPDVTVASDPFQKQDAVGRMMDELTAYLPDDFQEFVGSGRWEDSYPDE